MVRVYASSQGALGRERGSGCPGHPAANLGQCPPLLRVWQGPVPQSPEVSTGSGFALTSYVTLIQHLNLSELWFPRLRTVIPPPWGLIVKTEGDSVSTHKHHYTE